MYFTVCVLIILVLVSCGCQEKNSDGEKNEVRVLITPGEEYVVKFPGSPGELLAFDWTATSNGGNVSIFWQLVDDNSTRVPGTPLTIQGFETGGDLVLELYQNATYELVFQNLGDSEITLRLKWEVR